MNAFLSMIEPSLGDPIAQAKSIFHDFRPCIVCFIRVLLAVPTAKLLLLNVFTARFCNVGELVASSRGRMSG